MFDVFRKYQKSMLAVLAILAMFAFIFSGAIDTISRNQNGGDPVVATAWNRKIKRSEVYEVAFERSKINELIRRAAAHAKLPRVRAGFQTDSDSVIAGIAFAMRAEALGITISDQEVMDWLNRVTEEKLSADDFKGLLDGSINPFQDVSGKEKSGLGLSEYALFSALARELAAERLLSVTLPPAATVLDAPIEIWNEESPKLTQVALEFVEIPVSKFEDASAQPTPQQLQDTYNKYATIEANPSKDQIGFLLPRRVSFDYLEGTVDALAAAETVTDEEIAAYYEANKQDFVEVPRPTIDTSTPATPAPPVEATPEAPAAPEVPKGTETPAEPAAPAPPATTAPEKQNASIRGRWPSIAETITRAMISPLASYQEAVSNPPAPTEPAPTPPAPVEPATPTPAPAPAADPATPPTAPSAAPTEETPPAAAPPTPRQKPLEEVKEEIRKILQKQKAEKTLKAKMQKLIDTTLVPYRIDKYDAARREYESTHQKDGSVDWSGFTPPELPDMAKIAAEQGFELKQAGPVAASELEKLGSLASATRVDRRAGTGRPESIRETAFGPNVGDDLYAGRMMFDPATGNAYVYWKTKDETPKPQPLDEVKEQLTTIWRKESAQPKAKELAQQLIDKAKASEGKLDAGLPKEMGLEVKSTDTFPRVRLVPSSVTPGLEQPLEVKIANIPGAGEAFLDEVFKHKQGEFAIIPDEKNENLYVVKVAKKIEPDFAAFAQRYRNNVVMRRQLAQFPEYAQQMGAMSQSIVARQILQEAKIDPPLFQPRKQEMESSDRPSGTEG
jgi:hypothetical protein